MKSSIPRAAALLAASTCFLSVAEAAVVTFEDLPLGGEFGPEGVWNGRDGSGGITRGGVEFPNAYTDFGGGFYAWGGFAYSNHTDASTPGFGNQFSAAAGGGHAGSATYAVSYGDGASMRFASTVDGSVAGAWFTNTTYAALAMRDGDSFSKKFGGASGADPDFLILTLQGWLGGVAGATMDFALADYRFADNAQDFIVTDWTWLGFGALGTFDEIRFSYSSSDVGMFGINTPTYFAMDSLVIPEPGSAALTLLAALALLQRRNRKSTS